MGKPTVYVLLACIVVMVIFFIVMERVRVSGHLSTSEELCMSPVEGWVVADYKQ